MTLNILDGVATTIATLIESMTVSFTASANTYTSTVNAFVFAPVDLDGPGPWAVVELPTIIRTGVDLPESRLGSNDWHLSYPVEFYFDLAKPAYTQAQAINTIEAFIKTVDADNSLGSPVIDDAKVVTSGPPALIEDTPRVQLNYSTVVELLRIV